jgi:hypothetical protein
MSILEQFAITVILGLLQLVIKNPTSAADVKDQLIGVANDIYAAYGLWPPTPAPTAAPSVKKA